MSNFSDRRFVAGTIVGLRSFSTDKLGRLTGVVVKQVWTPGENVADCRKSEVYSYTYNPGGLVPSPAASPQPACGCHMCRMYGGNTHGYSPGGFITRAITDAVSKPGKPHDVATLTCECGFYAYFDGGNDYAAKATVGVSGIVEGYGHVVAGTRGFRAEKARILALIKPSRDDLGGQMAWERVQHNYAGTPVFDTALDAAREFPLSEAIVTPETADDFWTRSVS